MIEEDGTKARGVIAVCVALLLAIALIGSFVLNPSERQQSNLNLIIGALIGALSTIVGFYFGSSSGSKALRASQDIITQKVLNAVTPSSAGSNALSNAKPAGTATDPVVTKEVATVATGEPATLTTFRAQMKEMNPAVAEDAVMASYRVMYPNA